MKNYNINMMIMHLITFLVLGKTFSQSTSDLATHIVDLDGYPQKLTSFPWLTSQLALPFSGVQYKINRDTNATLPESSMKIRPEEIVLMTMHETFGTGITLLVIYMNGTALRPGYDYNISSSIEKSVIPNNYYTGVPLSSNSSKPAVSCFYANLGMGYTRGIKKDVGLTSIVNSLNFNFGLKVTGESGIVVLKMKNLSSSYSDLDSYFNLADSSNLPFATKNITFANLFISSPHYTTKTLLAGVSKSKVLVFEVNDSNETNLILKPDVVIHDTLLDNAVITQFGFYQNLYIFSSEKGLNIIRKESNGDLTRIFNPDNNSTSLLNNSQYNITDFIVNNLTLYAIDYKVGMRIFDLVNLNWTSTLLSHTNLVKFDYMTLNRTSMSGSYFVGIAVNNDPDNNIPEFFIELVGNLNYEYTPKVNKIFTSHSKIIITDIASDTQSDFTYVFDRTSKSLIILTRSVPYISQNFNFRINFADFYNFTNNVTEPLFILAENGRNLPPSLAIKNGKDLILFSNFSYPNTVLTCQFFNRSTYRMEMHAIKDCSTGDFVNNNYSYQTCLKNISQMFYVEGDPWTETDLSGLWAILAIVLAIIFGVLIAVCCCRRRCKRLANAKEAGEIEYARGSNREHNAMVEVQVENKL